MKNDTTINNDFITKLIEIEKQIEKISSSKDYIMWLNQFTINHQSFSDDEWLYSKDKISNEDYENVLKLHLLYTVIDNYATKNYIYSLPSEYGEKYYFKINDIGYEISYMSGQGTVFFINRVKINDEIQFIDFNDIINNKKQSNVDEITIKLNEIKNKILQLYQNGIPYNAIENCLSNTMNEMKKTEKEKKLELK